MGVKFRNLNIVGGRSGRVTFFEDDFIRTATSSGVGDQYLSGPQPGVIEAVGCSVFTTGTTFAIRASAVNQNIRTSIVYYPRPIIPFVTADQFAECTLVSDNSLSGTANIAGGLFLLSGWNTGNLGYRDYSVWWQGADGGVAADSLRLRRMTGPSTEVALGTTASGTAVAGDVLRMEVTIQPTQNLVECFINGASVLAVADNSATRPMFGNPGLGRLLWNSGAVPGIRTQEFGAFSCGEL